MRQRGKEGLEPYPAREPLRRFLDRVMFLVALLVPIALLPQVIQIYGEKDASGLSIYTWVLLTFGNALWALYGFVHRDKIILLANVLITLLNLSVVIGILKYS